MKKYVLDSFALLAYCEGEDYGIWVKDILKQAIQNEAEIYISVINWGEMYYIALREGGDKRADIYKSVISQFPVEIIDADMEHTITAAKYKAHYKMSYADAFAAGLAEIRNAVLVTGDKEFKQIEDKIDVYWLK